MTCVGKRNMGLHKNSPFMTLYSDSAHCLEKAAGFTENRQLRKKLIVLLQATKQEKVRGL